jgi:hypothetical protein
VAIKEDQETESGASLQERTVYVCYYQYGAGLHTRAVYVESIFDVMEGFWLNRELIFTKASNCRYWIPPSRILYVEKVRKHQ